MNNPLAYNFKFPITNENFVDQILRFDELFLRAGAKFELYFVPGMELEDFIARYKAVRTADFFGDLPQCFTLVELGQLKRVDSALTMKSFQTTWHNTEKPESGASNYKDFYSIENSADHYAEDLANEEFWYEFVSVSLGTFSDEWEQLNASVRRQLIPRINSFLREVNEGLAALEGEIEIDEYTPECLTPEGILVAGEVVYG